MEKNKNNLVIYQKYIELIDYTKKKIKEIYNIDLILEQEIIR